MMKRRSFLKSVSGAALGTLCPGRALTQSLIPAFSKTPRVAVGGIGAECSTYSRLRLDVKDFDILRANTIFDSPYFSFLKRYEVPFLPTLFASAFPAAPLRRAAYNTIKAEYLDRLKALLPLDGVYLFMHGALNVEGMDDAEGDWYEATRAIVGPDCLLSVTYDLHGNLSQRIVDNLDMFSAYRTAPHLDRLEACVRSTDMLLHCLRFGIKPFIVWSSVPVLLPGEQSSTEWEPGRRLWSDLNEFNELPGILEVSQLVGYVWADEPRSAGSIVITGTDPAMQKKVATELAQRYWEARKQFTFGSDTGSVDECIQRAIVSTTHPVVISDSGDNPGGGGNSDQTFFLQALLKAGAKDVLLGGMTDRPATDACYAAGINATISLLIGGTIDPVESKPVRVAAAKVKFLLQTDKPLDRVAVVEFDGITATLCAKRSVYHSVDAFRALGLEPKTFQTVVLKCGYLHATMKPIANPALMALSPGVIDQDIARIENKHRVPTYPWVAELRYTPKPYLSARADARARELP